MDGTGDSHEELDTAEKMKPEASKKRKAIQKAAAAAAVVTVMKVVESTSSACVKQKSEGPPLDSWSWRKYGQKPIKGSPFPRGYYRCSSSKGCSAKKQVERCKTDSDMIIITYTSDHNHPCPQPQQHHLSSITPKKEYQDPQQQLLSEDQTFITSSTTDEDEEHQQEQQEEEAHIFHYLYSQSPPLKSSLEYQDPFCQHVLVADDFDGEQLHDHHHHLSLQSSHDQLLLPLPITLTSHQDQDQDQEENDGFFNDLEELPIFTRTSLFHHDRILVHPPS